MKKTLTSLLVALSVLGGIATTANAATYPYGDRTNSQQEPSPELTEARKPGAPAPALMSRQ